MGRLDEMFERVERIGIYVVLIVLIIGPIFASLFPSIGMHFDQSEGIILLSVVILFLFRYLDRNFRNLSTRGLVRANSLLEAITSIFTNKSSCEHVDIFAHTSNVYYQGIQQKSVTVNHIRLLLRKMDDVNDMVLPCVSMISETRPTLKSVQNQGRGETISISRRQRQQPWAKLHRHLTPAQARAPRLRRPGRSWYNANHSIVPWSGNHPDPIPESEALPVCRSYPSSSNPPASLPNAPSGNLEPRQ